MRPQNDKSTDISLERQHLEKAGTLHWFHWLIIALSLLLTFGAWYFAQTQLEEKIKFQFEREADQVVDLIVERMKKYEDGLWSGVGLIQTIGGDVDYPTWTTFAESLRLETKYPGINGIGVIHRILPEQLEAYLADQRQFRPQYRLHPQHDKKEYWPISYIIPVEPNKKAVGLDMAHETNRFIASKKAQDTGLAQITGPITLVQDAEKTPGFLFFAPFYRGGRYETVADRQQNFAGMVYAPFVVTKLMEGVLSKQKRHVGIRMTDLHEVLYDEHVQDETDFDRNPLFSKKVMIPLYGRDWNFDVRSTLSFRAAASNTQPFTILIGGLVIDGLLLTLFILNSRASRRALEYADRANQDLQQQTVHLTKANKDLDDFSYIASHDLKEPLRGIHNYTRFLTEDFAPLLTEDGREQCNTIMRLAQRMEELINALLHYSRTGRIELGVSKVNLDHVIKDVLDTLKLRLEEGHIAIRYTSPLPSLHCNKTQVGEIFLNLITNAMKYNNRQEKWIEIGYRHDGAIEGSGKHVSFSHSEQGSSQASLAFYVRDNGIGIPEKHQESIFRIFKRLHGQNKFGGGTGAGLTISQKIVERHGGTMWVESTVDEGSTFWFTLQAQPSPTTASEVSTGVGA